MISQTNDQLKLAFDFLQYTGENVFLTGKAGTGKTTFLHNLRKKSPKRMVVVAPTGVAAINAGGVTIHSFFQISLGPQLPFDLEKPQLVKPDQNGYVNAGVKRFSSEKINIIRSLDLLVIDEISMVRADILDAIDQVLRRFRSRHKPFGGVQLLMIGDLQQLAPIVKDDEWEILKNYYETCFFFSSRALKQSSFVSIELTHIFRQTDRNFIEMLNAVRENKIDDAVLKQLNRRYISGFNPPDNEGYITLTTHNYQSQQINDNKLFQLKTSAYSFNAFIEGDFPESAYPTEYCLTLKVGAQVMFVKNDYSPEKRYFNGKIGSIKAIDDGKIIVLCPGDFNEIEVEVAEWQNYKYEINPQSQEIEEIVLGKFVQFPLKLAWAITIHKSQGLTFEKAIIDARLSFAHGQVYVALSRCKSIEGLVLSSPIEIQSVKNDTTVLRFSTDVENNQPGEKELVEARSRYEGELIADLFDFKPVLFQIQQLMRTLSSEKENIQGNLAELLGGTLSPIQNDLIVVADKFQRQVEASRASYQNMLENDAFQGRIKNGCIYFLEKMNAILGALFTSSSFQSDNKAIRTSVNESVAKIEKSLAIKNVCLQAMKNGFSVKEYLEIRSKAAIEKPAVRMQGVGKAEIAGMKYPEFFRELKAWRSKKADELDVSEVKVLSGKVLFDLATTLPETKNRLKSLKGFGSKKMSLFGNELLSMIVKFRKEKGLELAMESEKETKMPSHQYSYQLFKSGKTIREIASMRNLAESTIEGHLFNYIEKGDLDTSQFIDDDSLREIQDYFLQHENPLLGQAKAHFGDRFSYQQLRIASLLVDKEKFSS